MHTLHHGSQGRHATGQQSHSDFAVTVTSGVRCLTTRRALPPGGNIDKGFSLLEWTNKVLPQGALVSGVKESWRLAWQTMVKELAPQDKDGSYKRPSYKFQGRIGDAQFPAESGRYHLYVGNACGWCHRVLLAVVLRGLARPAPGSSQPHISVTHLVDDPTRARRGGWVFDARNPDPVWGAADLWEVYDTASPGFKGRCTAPLLVDKKTKRVVSNESADIVAMLNDLHLPGCTDVDLRPKHLLSEIEVLNQQIYDSINNGVYKAGFSTTQAAYNTAQAALFEALDDLEARLTRQPYLLGDRLTEPDVRLLPTLTRFDAVYSTIFRCTRVFCGIETSIAHRRKRIKDYPALSHWMMRMWRIQVPESLMQVSNTVDVDAARQSYFTNLFPLNPSAIVPAGPTAEELGLTSAAAMSQPVPIESVCHSRAQPAVVN